MAVFLLIHESHDALGGHGLRFQFRNALFELCHFICVGFGKLRIGLVGLIQIIANCHDMREQSARTNGIRMRCKFRQTRKQMLMPMSLKLAQLNAAIGFHQLKRCRRHGGIVHQRYFGEHRRIAA